MSETTAVRERPILMSGPLVREILAGRKTMTRRPVKGAGEHGPMPCMFTRSGWARCADRETMECTCKPVPCPYDADRLWVRETFAQNENQTSDVHVDTRIVYRADGEERALDNGGPKPWTPGIHMPRWACRLVLEVKDVRVERLQAITEEDARAEGVADRAAFQAKWIEIYGQESWDASPFVWCITFRRLTP